MLGVLKNDTHKAFAALEHNPNFIHIVDLFRKRLSDLDKDLRRSNGESIGKTQGMSLMLESILQECDNAARYLQR